MADTNHDGTSATTAQRAYNFLSNGGGAITMRMVMIAALITLSAVIGHVGTEALDDLKALRDGQNAMQQTQARQTEDIANNKANSQSAWGAIGGLRLTSTDHERRLSYLEGRAGQPPQP